MNSLFKNHQPSLALVKAVECIGILIGSPTRNLRSRYLTPLPSNYSDTVGILFESYNEISSYINGINVFEIPNEMAFRLYSKSQEDGVDFKKAIGEVEHEISDVFVSITRIIESLPTSKDGRIPIEGSNILVVITGSRSSFTAFNFGTQLQGYQFCSILTLVDEMVTGINSEQTLKYLNSDISRRCIEQYKIRNNYFHVEVTIAQGAEDVKSKVQSTLQFSNNVELICMGIDDCNIGLDGISPLHMWAAWNSNIDVAFTKGISRVTPFSGGLKMARNVIIHIPMSADDVMFGIIEQSLKFIRPDDYVIFIISTTARVSKGDNRESRFDFGKRMCGTNEQIISSTSNSYPFNVNDKKVERTVVLMNQMLRHIHSEGTVRFIYELPFVNISNQLCKSVTEDNVDVLILKRVEGEISRSLIVSCMQDCLCTLVLLK